MFQEANISQNARLYVVASSLRRKGCFLLLWSVIHVPPGTVKHLLYQTAALPLKRHTCGEFNAACGDHKDSETQADSTLCYGGVRLIALGEAHVDQQADC